MGSMWGRKFSEIFFGGVLPPKQILVPADYPTLIEATRDVGRHYYIGGPTGFTVTDNDSTKTNTNQTFTSGDDIVWDQVSAYLKLGSELIWEQDLIEAKLRIATDINLGTKGLKDIFATIGIKLADALNTSLFTTNKTLAGGINEVLSLIPVVAVNNSTFGGLHYFAGLRILADGQTAFTISNAPQNNQGFMLDRNGVRQVEGEHFTLVGTVLTWIDGTTPLSATLDQLIATINFVVAPTTVKTFREKIDGYNNNNLGHRCRSLGGTGSFLLETAAPADMVGFPIKVELICSPSAGAAGSGKDIDFTRTSGGNGDLINLNVESNTTGTYDLGVANTFTKIDVTSVFTNVVANEVCGLEIDNNSIGGTNFYYFLDWTYSNA